MKNLFFLNKKKKNLFLIFFLFSFLIIINSIESKPEITYTQDFSEGYVLEGSPQYSILKNENLNYNFFVYNVSNGIPISNSSTKCYFFITNNKGDLIFSDEVKYNGQYWNILISGTNFTNLGLYPYGVRCNSSSLGGALVGEFEVTSSGFGLYNTLAFYFIIFFVSIIFIIIGFSIKDGWVVIFGTFGLYFIGLYMLINGIVGIKDTAYTYAISIIILGIAGYLSIQSAKEMID